DSSAALALPGVLAVLTGEDVKASGFKPLPSRSVGPGRGGMERRPAGKNLLAIGKVRFVGEAVACVIAETTSLAHDAVELIAVDYEDLPVVTTAREALAPGAPQLHDTAPGNLIFDYETGDEAGTDAAFKIAARVVRVVIDNPRQVGNPMEPR